MGLSGISILHELRERCALDGQTKAGVGLVWDSDASLSLPALQLGCVHEWHGVLGESEHGQLAIKCPSARRSSHMSGHKSEWTPALSLITQCVSQSLTSRPAHHAQISGIVWVGRRVWPCPAFLRYSDAMSDCDSSGNEPNSSALAHRVASQSIFVDAPTPFERIWATDLALRLSPHTVVVADGSGFDMAATRRLQLATQASGGLCLLARPPWEVSELSAATTRWMVRRAVSPIHTRRWTVELLRCKGMQPSALANLRPWTVEHDHATRSLRVVSDVGNGLDAATTISQSNNDAESVRRSERDSTSATNARLTA